MSDSAGNRAELNLYENRILYVLREADVLVNIVKCHKEKMVVSHPRKWVLIRMASEVGSDDAGVYTA